MLDASSTALYIAQKIKDKKNITLITNSVEILYETSDMAGWKIFSTGGIMAEGAMALIGTYANSMVERLACRKDHRFLQRAGKAARHHGFLRGAQLHEARRSPRQRKRFWR